MFNSQPEMLRPIDEVAEELGLELESVSLGEYRALCPVHNDTEPSLCISTEKQVWYCHGCGVGGNVLTLARHLGADGSIATSDVPPGQHLRFQFEFPGDDTLEDRFAAVSRLASLLPADLLREIDRCAVREEDAKLSTLLDRALVEIHTNRNLVLPP